MSATGVAFTSSQPVTDPNHDAFARKPFAQQVARMIRANEARQPPVIGIVGPWGCGKSSILHMAESYLNEEEHPPAVVWFNPWSFAAAGRGAIQEALLEQVTWAAIANAPDKRRRKRLAQLTKDYGSGAVRFLRQVPYVGSVVGEFGETALAKLPDRRRELIDEMTRAGQRIVVLVDDVDRLTGQEMLELFAALRTVADLPYVQYVLAYDSKYVATGIQALTNTDGNNFIEKVIELPLPVPAIPFGHLHRQVRDQARIILVTAGLDATFLDGYSAGSVKAYLTGTLDSPRDLIRFLNRLRSLAELAAQAELVSEDFLACEFLAVFYPELHQALTANQDVALLAREPASLLSFDDDLKQKAIDRAKAVFEPLLPPADTAAAARSSALASLNVILPDLAGVLLGKPQSRIGSHDRDGRLGDSAYFGRYFSYTAWLDDIPDAEVARRWAEVLAGRPLGEAFQKHLHTATAKVLEDKLLREVTNQPAEADVIRRVIDQASGLGDLSTPRSITTLDFAIGAYAEQRVDLPQVAAALVEANASDPTSLMHELVGTIENIPFAFEFGLDVLRARQLSDDDFRREMSGIAEIIARRLAEPRSLEGFEDQPFLLTDVARRAHFYGTSSFNESWTAQIQTRPELVETALWVTASVERSNPAEYLANFVDPAAAARAIEQLDHPSDLAREWLELLTHPATEPAPDDTQTAPPAEL